MNATKNPKHIHISIRRWRDKVNGSSYFSARVIADGAIKHIPFQYGYGSQPFWVSGSEVFGHHCHIASECEKLGIIFTEDEAFATKRECVAYGA